MSNLHNERYDEIKSLLKKSRFIFEQSPMTSDTESEPDTQINVAKDIEARASQDNREYETAQVETEKSSPVISILFILNQLMINLHSKKRWMSLSRKYLT